MNKKGFTLVEILVSIGLLALLGSVIAISLNRVFKDNNIKNYNEYVEKVKSSAMLYVNNMVDIINDLNDSSFKIITIGNLIDNGYFKDNIINPNTNKKIDKNEKIKVSYDSDHELIVEYPYNNSEIEAYLYTLNYSAMYGDTTDNLCYVGLNTRSLQLINLDGQKVKDLILNQTIRAYMENGEECTNITSEKIGTYKIRYDYTKEDNKTLDDSDVNKRSAERTITVKPSKPIINKFEVTKDKNAVYNPTITYNVSDSSKKTDMILKYCINTTGKINDCSNWSEAKNSQDTSLKINLNDLDKNISGKNKVDIYFFVKNGFEEYTYRSQNYKIKTEVIVKLNGGKYNNDTNDFTKYVDNGVKLGSVITLSLFTRDNHKFEGLKNTSGTSYNADTVITDNVTLTAQWYEYCVNKTLKSTSCSKTCGGGNIINHYVDTKYSSWECGEEATSKTCNTQNCYTRCDETYTIKECEQYSDWPIQYHYYKYDKRDNSLCESWWSGETCSLNGDSGSSETKCQCVTPAVSSGACYCASSGDPGTSGVIEYHWKSSTGEGLCCCIPAGCKW
ncbi:MAG: prepilin-type N-terminal cleavage/methylation domain-containing protein [Tenericutes bacterium]|nr:prepilin-type N-terminal cleavage/methylation domain-containing protein [Mycoplasmatota bacterium]